MELTTTTLIDLLAIVLSIVALLVTIIGFFASLRFYRAGMESSRIANNALAKINEKTESIGSHVGKLFKRTLNAAIRNNSNFDKHFDSLNRRIDDAHKRLIAETNKVVSLKNEADKDALIKLINEEIESVTEEVNATREGSKFMTYSSDVFDMCNSSSQQNIIHYLDGFDEEWVSLSALASRGNMKKDEARDFLSQLVEAGHVQRTSDGSVESYRIVWQL